MQKRTANIHNTTKYRHLQQILKTQPNIEVYSKYSYNPTKYRNMLQTFTTQPNAEAQCKYLQHNQIRDAHFGYFS